MNVATFASTRNLIRKRAIARNLQVRAFFMPYCQVFNQDIAVACRFERKPYIPFLNYPLFGEFLVDGNGGNRFLICYRKNKKFTMSKVTPFTKEEIFEGFAFESSATQQAKYLRQCVIDALANEDADLESAQRTLFLAELLQDIATDWAKREYEALKNRFVNP
jgi:hypothetical protein